MPRKVTKKVEEAVEEEEEETILEDEDQLEVEEQEEEEEEEEVEEEKPKAKKGATSSTKRKREKEEKKAKERKARKLQEEQDAAAAKEAARLVELKKNAHSNWMPFIQNMGGNIERTLFTSVPVDSIHLKPDEKGENINVRYFVDAAKKKSFGVNKWTVPLYVEDQWTRGDGNYNPTSKFSNTYKDARYSLTVTDYMPPDLEEILDRDWLAQDPETRSRDPPHVQWQNACTGFFEHLLDIQNHCLDQLYKMEISKPKIDAFRADQITLLDQQIAAFPELKKIKKGTEAYERMVENGVRASFMSGAAKFISKNEEDGSYKLKAKRRVFVKMTDEEKKAWKARLDEERKKGNTFDDVDDEFKPLLEFLKRKPLRIADCNRRRLQQPDNYKIPVVTKSAMIMMKTSVLAFVTGDVYGTSMLLSSWKDEEEIIMFRKGEPPSLAVNEEKPLFLGAETIEEDYETKTNTNESEEALFLNKYRVLGGAAPVPALPDID